MKVYISGDETKVEQFARAERYLLLLDQTPINTLLVDLSKLKLNERELVKANFDILSTCDCIYMLKDWQRSKRAKAELAYAKLLKIKVKYEDKQWALKKQQITM